MVDSDSDSDLDEEELSLHDKIKKLEKKANETRGMLDSINQALLAQGNPREVLFPSVYAQFKPQSGIRINNSLSFRGEQMAEELYDYLDPNIVYDTNENSNYESKIGFEEVRATLSQANYNNWGFAHKHENLDPETWRLLLFDLDIIVDDQFYIDKENFKKLRKIVESKQPLAAELERSKLAYLPKLQVKWGSIKRRIREALLDRTEAENMEFARDPDYLDMEEMSFVMCSTGFIYSKTELLEGMIVRARLEKVLQQLKRKVFKRDYVDSPERYRGQLLNKGLPPPEDDVSREDVKKRDLMRIRPDALLAWLHSDGLKPALPGLHRLILQTRYTGMHYIRVSLQYASILNRFSLYFRDRNLFEDFISIAPVEVDRKQKKGKNPKKEKKSAFQKKMAAHKQGEKKKEDREAELQAELEKEKNAEAIAAKKAKDLAEINARSTANFTIKVGEDDIGDEGSQISLTMKRVDKIEGFLGARGLPKDCGCMFVVELLVRDDAPESQVDKAVMDAKLVFMRAFDSELSRTEYYKGFYMLQGLSESDGARVIRIGLGYRRAVSLDALFKQAKLPYTLCDLIPSLTIEAKLNVHFLDVLMSSQTVQMDTMLAFKAQLNVECRRNVILKLMRRLQSALCAGEARRTVSEAIERQRINAEKAKTKSDESSTTDGGPDVSSFFADQWSSLKTYFKTAISFCKTTYDWLLGTDTVMRTWEYKTLSDYLEHLGVYSDWFRINLPASLGREQGAVPDMFKRLTNQWKKSVNERMDYIGKHLDSLVVAEEKKLKDDLLGLNRPRRKPVQKKDEDESETESESSEEGPLDEEGFAQQGQGRPDTAEANKKKVKLTKEEIRKMKEEEEARLKAEKEAALLGRLAKLGVQVEEEDLFVGVDDGESLESIVATEEEHQRKAVINQLHALERLWHSVVGIHVVEFVAGNTRVTAKCSGVDLMEILPEPPSIIGLLKKHQDDMDAVKEKYGKKKKSAAPSAANAGL